MTFCPFFILVDQFVAVAPDHLILVNTFKFLVHRSIPRNNPHNGKIYPNSQTSLLELTVTPTRVQSPTLPPDPRRNLILPRSMLTMFIRCMSGTMSTRLDPLESVVDAAYRETGG